MKLQPYPEYKASNVTWIGNLPSHWALTPLKHIVATPITDGPHETPNFVDDGIPFVSAEAISSGRINFAKIRACITKEDHDRYSQKYLPQRGDIYMVKSGATTGITAIVDTDAEFNIWSPLAAIRCGSRAVPLYVLNVMRSGNFQEAVELNWSFGTQQNIGMGVIENLPMIMPPVQEQRAIAAFLDRETAKIDTLISEQEKLIKLLREKRQAAISHAVTKGLDPTVPMKPSGIEWMGDVPEHWGVTRLKYAASLIVDCPHDTPVYDPDGEFLVIRTADVSAGNLNLEGAFRLNEEEYIRRTRRSALIADDIVYGREGERWGFAALVPDMTRTCLGQRMMQFRSGQSYNHAFLMWHLNADCVYSQGEVDVVGATAPHVNVETIRNYVLCEPPHEEQKKIAAFLQVVIRKIDTLIAKAQQAIALQKEHRTALISAAVTGKIDVREAASELQQAA